MLVLLVRLNALGAAADMLEQEEERKRNMSREKGIGKEKERKKKKGKKRRSAQQMEVKRVSTTLESEVE